MPTTMLTTSTGRVHAGRRVRNENYRPVRYMTTIYTEHRARNQNAKTQQGCSVNQRAIKAECKDSNIDARWVAGTVPFSAGTWMCVHTRQDKYKERAQARAALTITTGTIRTPCKGRAHATRTSNALTISTTMDALRVRNKYTETHCWDVPRRLPTTSTRGHKRNANCAT